MLESVDFKAEKMSKEDYKPVHDELVDKLVVLQQQARSKGVGLVVLVEGWSGAGKGTRISELVYELDARATKVHVTEDIDPKAARKFPGTEWGVKGDDPFMKQFWEGLGERGEITFYNRGWYTAAAEQALFGLTKADPKEMKKLAKKIKGLPDGERGAAAVRNALAHDAIGTYQQIAYNFEKMLVDDGYAVVKLFVHVSKKAQRKRLEQLRDNPDTAWRVSKRKLQMTEYYDDAYKIFDRLLEGSNFEIAPWTIVNGEDRRTANIQIAKELVDALERALAAGPDAAAEAAKAKAAANSAALAGEAEDIAEDESAEEVEALEVDAAEGVEDAGDVEDADVEAAEGVEDDADVEDAEAEDEAAESVETESVQVAELIEAEEEAAEDVEAVQDVLETAEEEAAAQSALAPRESNYMIMAGYPQIDHSKEKPRIDDEDEYRTQLKAEQGRFRKLQEEMYQKRVPLMVMYEGWDAAGKGGNIKRIAQAIDARAYQIFPSPAPSKVELAHPHLWRYWTRLPKAGRVGIYDRSWYGRVLVERVEGFASPEQWGRAYDEINAFERELVQWGAVLLKFWVDITPDEQLARFEARAADPTKTWKLTDEDWRNRDKYPQYKAAVDDMFRLTSTEFAPWTVLESDSKWYARIQALKAINEALEARLHR